MNYLLLLTSMTVIGASSQEYRIVSTSTLDAKEPVARTEIYVPADSDTPKYVFNWTASRVVFDPNTEAIAATTMGSFLNENFPSVLFYKGTNFVRGYSTRQIWDLVDPDKQHKSLNPIFAPWGIRYTLGKPQFVIETNTGLLLGFNMTTGEIERKELAFDYLRFTAWFLGQEANDRKMPGLRIYAGKVSECTATNLDLTQANELITGKAFSWVKLARITGAEMYKARYDEFWCFVVGKDTVHGGDKVVAACKLTERFQR